MGAADVGYLKRFGELPSDTFDIMRNCGCSVEESFQTVHRNMSIVSAALIEREKENKRLEQERLFAGCPFLNLQPPT